MPHPVSMGRLPRHLRNAARAALKRGIDALDFFDLKLTDPELALALSNVSRKFLRSLRRPPLPGHGFPLSSRAVRTASAQAMVEMLLQFGVDNPQRLVGLNRIRMLTMCPDIGLVNIVSGPFPAERTKLVVRRAMQHQPVQGLGMLDLSLFSPGRGQSEHLAHIHSHHVILPTLRRGDTLAELKAALTPVKKPINGLEAPVAEISKQEPAISDQQLAGLGWYITKESCGANTIFESSVGKRSECSFTDWSIRGALRQLEFWSYIDVLQACWGVGSVGTLMRTTWRRRLLELLDFCELPRPNMIDFEFRRAGWRKVWKEIGGGFRPIEPDALLSSRSN